MNYLKLNEKNTKNILNILLHLFIGFFSYGRKILEGRKGFGNRISRLRVTNLHGWEISENFWIPRNFVQSNAVSGFFFFVKDSVKKVGFDGYDASSLPQWASCTVLHFWDLERKVLWNTLLFPYICCVLIHLFWVFLQNRFTLCPEVEKSIFPCSVKPL